MRSLHAYKRSDMPVSAWRRLLDSERTFAVLSPRTKDLPRSDTKARLSEMFRELQAKGYRPRSVQGQWEGGSEPALLVPDISFEEAVRLGKAYAQEAIIYKDPSGVVGMYHLQRGVVQVPSAEGKPLAGMQALQLEPRPAKPERGLYSGLRAQTFSVRYDWADSKAELSWTGEAPVDYAQVREHYQRGDEAGQAPEANEGSPSERPGRDARVQARARPGHSRWPLGHFPLEGGAVGGAVRLAQGASPRGGPSARPSRPHARPLSRGAQVAPQAPATSGVIDLEDEDEDEEEDVGSYTLPVPAAERAIPPLRLDPGTVWEWRGIGYDYATQQYVALTERSIGQKKRDQTRVRPGDRLTPAQVTALGIVRDAPVPFTAAVTGVVGPELTREHGAEMLTLAEREAVRRQEAAKAAQYERTQRFKRLGELRDEVDQVVQRKVSIEAAVRKALPPMQESAQAAEAKRITAELWALEPEDRKLALLDIIEDAYAQLHRQVHGDLYLPRHLVDAPAASTLTFEDLKVRPVQHNHGKLKPPEPKARKTGVENILKLLRAARPDEIRYWRDWYRHAHEDVQELARRYPHVQDAPEVVAGVVAALSPNVTWETNIRAAELMLRGAGRVARYYESVNAPRVAENALLRAFPELLPKPKATSAIGSLVYIDNVFKAQRLLDAWERSRVRPDEHAGLQLTWPDNDTENRAAYARIRKHVDEGWTVTAAVDSKTQRVTLRPGDVETFDAFLATVPAFSLKKGSKTQTVRRVELTPILGDAASGARKVNTFFASIRDPEKTKDRVTVDGHAYNIWRGKPVDLSKVGTIKDTTQIAVEEDYREAARRSGPIMVEKGLGDEPPLLPQEVQAITWSVWRQVVKEKKDKDRDILASRFAYALDEDGDADVGPFRVEVLTAEGERLVEHEWLTIAGVCAVAAEYAAVAMDLPVEETRARLYGEGGEDIVVTGPVAKHEQALLEALDLPPR